MKRFIGVAIPFALPLVAFAQSLGNLTSLASAFGNLVNILLPIVVALALLAFFWGLAKFIFAAGDETKRDEGKKIMIWGIVALFIMVSIWGLVQFIQSALLGGSGPQTVPIPRV